MAETLAVHAMRPGAPLPSLRELVAARTRGNQRRAAAELGCLPTTLNEKLRRLGLRACDRPEAGEVIGVSRGGDHGTLELTGTA